MLEAGVNVGLGVDGAGSGVDSQDILVSEQRSSQHGAHALRLAS